MNNSEIDLGIVDVKNIIRNIRENYQYDFSDYALTSFKRRLEHFMVKQDIKYPDLLEAKLNNNDLIFFDQFLCDISTDTSEMFRDPSLWRFLRDNLLKQLLEESPRLKIWIPNSVSGEELFTLTIVLKEMDALDKAEIIVSCLSQKAIEQIKSGIFNPSKVNISGDNYKRFNGKSDLSSYYQNKENCFFRDISLLKNVSFIKQTVSFENLAERVKLILFRNRMIYFNNQLQQKMLNILHDCLLPGGYLIVGTKESLGEDDRFSLACNSESIYKKKN